MSQCSQKHHPWDQPSRGHRRAAGFLQQPGRCLPPRLPWCPQPHALCCAVTSMVFSLCRKESILLKTREGGNSQSRGSLSWGRMGLLAQRSWRRETPTQPSTYREQGGQQVRAATAVGLEELLDGGNAQFDPSQGLFKLSLQPLHHLLRAQEVSGLEKTKAAVGRGAPCAPWPPQLPAAPACPKPPTLLGVLGGPPAALAGFPPRPTPPPLAQGWLGTVQPRQYHLNEEVADLLQDDDDPGGSAVVLRVHPGEADGVQDPVDVGLELPEQGPR